MDSSTTKTFPLGIKARWVPELDKLMGLDSGNKIKRLRTRQAVFLHNVSRQQDYEIENLDYVDPLMGYKTLRSIIMQIKVQGKPKHTTFPFSRQPLVQPRCYLSNDKRARSRSKSKNSKSPSVSVRHNGFHTSRAAEEDVLPRSCAPSYNMQVGQ